MTQDCHALMPLGQIATSRAGGLALDTARTLPSDAALGVFDSGVGGLSILRHIQTVLPDEDVLYFADSGYAPYGEKTTEAIVERSFAIAQFLLAQGAKALVVACNTATVASIRMLRQHYPDLPLVGVEPGLKPAATISKTGIVGVLATERTLHGDKFLELQQQISQTSSVRFVLQAATGLADLVERGELESEQTERLLAGWLDFMLAQQVDTLVLGCTHYPFVRPLIERLLAARQVSVQLVDTGDAVARQLQRVLQQKQLLARARQQRSANQYSLPLHCYTSGSSQAMQLALTRLLHVDAPVSAVTQAEMSVVNLHCATS